MKRFIIEQSDEEFYTFREALGNKDVPSESTMRQRMDEYAARVLAALSWASIENKSSPDSNLHRSPPS